VHANDQLEVSLTGNLFLLGKKIRQKNIARCQY
jgi:hypothetical protein